MSDSDEKRVAGDGAGTGAGAGAGAGLDVLEDTLGNELSVLCPEREAGPKRRGDKDYEDRCNAEIEETVFGLNAAALILIAHCRDLQLGWDAGILGCWEEESLGRVRVRVRECVESPKRGFIDKKSR